MCRACRAGRSSVLTILYPDCVGILSALCAWLFLTFSIVRCTEAFGAGLLFLEPSPDLHGAFVAPSVLSVPPRAHRSDQVPAPTFRLCF